MKSWFIILLFIESILHAPTPVAWHFSSKKLSDNRYEIHIIGDISNDWHIYSSKQPTGAISAPTRITFSANPLVTFVNSVQEIGLREAQKVEVLEITQYYIKNRVEYVQQISLKAPVKTNVSGTLTFQACTDHQCLQPQTIPFSLSLQ